MISHLSNHRSTRNVGTSRYGFTLVEILIVVTIIGLLVGLLVAVGGPAITRSREFAVTNEMQQISGAIEKFKIENGFYPPSFEQFKRQINTGSSPSLLTLQAEANQLLPYLNLIAPGHMETELVVGGAGRRRIDAWWERVGCNMDQTTSLQFWLSGLCHNNQYPLTGGLPTTGPFIPRAYNVDLLDNGTAITGGLERRVYFEFDTSRLVPFEITDDASGPIFPLAQYVMAHGKNNGDLFYVYRDSGSYAPPAQPVTIPPHPDNNSNNAGALTPPDLSDTAYLASDRHRGLAYHFTDGAGNYEFPNPDTFQLISFGLDGDAGLADSGLAAVRGNIEAQSVRASDNLCNFATGRLDAYITERQ